MAVISGRLTKRTRFAQKVRVTLQTAAGETWNTWNTWNTLIGAVQLATISPTQTVCLCGPNNDRLLAFGSIRSVAVCHVFCHSRPFCCLTQNSPISQTCSCLFSKCLLTAGRYLTSFSTLRPFFFFFSFFYSVPLVEFIVASLGYT